MRAKTQNPVIRETPQGEAVDERRARILIVDDEPSITRILTCWLEAEKYLCSVACSAEDAEDRLRNEEFALVLCDVGLPGKSGIDLLQATRGERLAVPMVMMTGSDDREMAVLALQTGAYGYVHKPFRQDELLINVFNALHRAELEIDRLHYQQSLERRIEEQTADIRQSREEIALRLIEAQSYRHDETGAHVRRIGLFSEILGGCLGLSREDTDILRLAAPMHDIGKIGIKDSILLKPGKLDAGEFEVMKQHTVIGARILGGSNMELLDTARDIALCHHEKWDGSGYPRGLSGKDIPETARIVSILDVYDALVNERVYREALREADALALIRQEVGVSFAPEMFAAFTSVLPSLRAVRASVPERGGEV